MTELQLGDVVYDESIYPRAEWSQSTVNRYAEALNADAEFPPIILERGTRRLLDGMHRWQAHKQALRDTISVSYVDVPADVPAKLYAASLSTHHGDRMTGDDLRRIAREVTEENPDYNLQTIAKYTSVTRQTVSKWVGDIVEHRREVRRVKAVLLSRAGWSRQQIADRLGISKGSAVSDVNGDISDRIDEALLREAAADLQEEIDVDAIVEELRQERIFATWSDGERILLEHLRAGTTIVVSLRGDLHSNLIGWADAAGLYVRIDRRTEWGNPFELPGDGDRETVIRNYAEHYLPHKPSLLSKLGSLRGKALGCWCAPETCHGDVLKARAES